MIDTFNTMSLNKIDIDSRLAQVIDKQTDPMEITLEKKKITSKKLWGAEAAMAASEELAEICSKLDEFEDVPEIPKKKASKKLWGAEAAMAASEELAELCSMFDE